MINKFQNIIHNDFPQLDKYNLYVACSGGADSMVLIDLLLKSNLKPTILHCNFKLRGQESEDDQKFIQEFAKTNNLKSVVKSFYTKSIANDTNENIQLTARNLRYKWFRSFDNGKEIILTAHHLDDAVETFFINILRGTGINGTKGIPKINPPFYRPLLEFSKSDIKSWITHNKLEFREDSSNKTTAYRRNKLRHDIIPFLKDLEPNFLLKMESYFEESQESLNYINQSIQKLKNKLFVQSNHLIEIERTEIHSLSKFVVTKLFEEYGIYRKNAREFMNFLNSAVGSKFITSSHVFSIDRKSVFIKNKSHSTIKPQIVHEFPTKIQLDEKTDLIFTSTSDNRITKEPNIQQLDLSKIQLPFIIRKWEQGDKIQPLGMSGKKLISDLLIDKKIPQIKKDDIVVVIDQTNNIIAIPGITINEKYKILDKSSTILNVTAVSKNE